MVKFAMNQIGRASGRMLAAGRRRDWLGAVLALACIAVLLAGIALLALLWIVWQLVLAFLSGNGGGGSADREYRTTTWGGDDTGGLWEPDSSTFKANLTMPKSPYAAQRFYED